MRIDVVTIFPEMIHSMKAYGVVGKALESGIMQLHTWNPRDYTHDVHRTVDDRPYGGGPGMVMKVEPLKDAVQAAKADSGKPAKVVYLSPQGRLVDQQLVCEAASLERLIFVAGRYEGIDERFIENYVDEEWSIGDYVLSGGELPVLVMVDAICRLLPGTLGHDQSAEQDSFMNGLLDCPHYTRPEQIEGQKVPDVLSGGNHQAIAEWRRQQALGRTAERRPDLLEKVALTDTDRRYIEEYFRSRQSKDQAR